jgi:RNA polymerase sigma-70 factor (ECF subfamily)
MPATAIHDPPVHRSGTLGALLYADGSKSRVPEEEWVALVRAVAARDTAALNMLYQRMHRVVFTLILRITRSREYAEELTVDVFHTVWRRAADFDPSRGTVVAWIMYQARSRAIDRMRYSDSLDIVAVEKPQSRLRLALQRLTADERLTIETAYFAGLTHMEVAACLDEPLETVKARIRSGLSKLREALARNIVTS